jgi:hypothetical protein
MKKNRNSSFVLYVDHGGHPAPLTECFIATAGHRLASRVRRYPASIAETMESAYCPNCLDAHFYDALTAVEQYGGYCPVCVQYPDCFATLAVQRVAAGAGATASPQYQFQCGRCDYSFTDHKAFPVPALQTILQQQRDELMAPYRQMMDYATHKWRNCSSSSSVYSSSSSASSPVQPQQESQQEPQRRSPSKSSSSQASQAWSMELLEAKMESFKARTDQKHSGELESTSFMQQTLIATILQGEEEYPQDQAEDAAVPSDTRRFSPNASGHGANAATPPPPPIPQQQHRQDHRQEQRPGHPLAVTDTLSRPTQSALFASCPPTVEITKASSNTARTKQQQQNLFGRRP